MINQEVNYRFPSNEPSTIRLSSIDVTVKSPKPQMSGIKFEFTQLNMSSEEPLEPAETIQYMIFSERP